MTSGLLDRLFKLPINPSPFRTYSLLQLGLHLELFFLLSLTLYRFGIGR